MSKKGNVANTQQEVDKLVNYLRGAITDSYDVLGEELTKKVESILSNKNVTRGTLDSIAKEVAATLMVDKITPKVETQAKVKVKSKVGASSKKEETKEPKKSKLQKGTPAKKVEESNESSEEVKETKETTKKETKKSAPKAVETRSLVVSFPEELKIADLGTLQLNSSIEDVKGLHEVINAGETLIFAVYWDERLLRQYEYDTMKIGTPVKKFDNDLDLCQILYVNENGKAIVTNSLYTEVLSVFLAKDLKVDPETGIRYANGAEFAIYSVK